MRNLKRVIAATTMAMVLFMGSTFANDGIIVLGAKSDGSTGKTSEPKSGPCTSKSTAGIIVTDLTGIIVLGFTGIIVTDFAGCSSTDVKTASTGIIVLG